MMGHRAIDDSFHADDVLQWDVDRMCTWLRQVGLKDAESYFRENRIGGAALTRMGPACVDIPNKIKKLDNNMKRKLANYLELFVKELHEAVTGNGRKAPPPPMPDGKSGSRPPMVVPPTGDDSDEFTDEEIYVNTEGDEDFPPPPPRQPPPGKRPAPVAIKSPPANDGNDSSEENYEAPVISPVSVGKGSHNQPTASRHPSVPLPPPIPPLDPNDGSEDEGLYAEADETRGLPVGPRPGNAVASKPAAPPPNPLGRGTAKPPSNDRSVPPLPPSVGRPPPSRPPAQPVPPPVKNPPSSKPPPLPPLTTSDDEDYVCPETEELYEEPPEGSVGDNKTKGRGRGSAPAPPPTPTRNPETKITSVPPVLPAGRAPPASPTQAANHRRPSVDAPSLPSRGKQNPKQVEVDEIYEDPDPGPSTPATPSARPGLKAPAPALPPQRQPPPQPSSGLGNSADEFYEDPTECDSRNNSHRSGSNTVDSDDDNYVVPGDENDQDSFYEACGDEAAPKGMIPAPFPPGVNPPRAGASRAPPPPAPPIGDMLHNSNASLSVTRRQPPTDKPIAKPTSGSSTQGHGVGQNTISKALGKLKPVSRPNIPIDDRAPSSAPPAETVFPKLKPVTKVPPVSPAQPVQPTGASPSEPEWPSAPRSVRMPLPSPGLKNATNPPSDKTTTNPPRPVPDQPPRKPLPIRDLPPPSPSLESGRGEMAATPLPPQERLNRPPPSSKAPIKLPVPPPATVDALDKHPWFFSNIDRKAAISKVQELGQNGAFLVRKSETGGEDAPYVLCVLHDGHPYNIQIRCRRADKKIALGHPKETENVFNSVEEMISFHINNPLEVSKEGKSTGMVRLGVSPEK